jgi:hypothetical protein
MIHLPFLARKHNLPRGPGLLRAWTDVLEPDWYERLPDHIKRNLDQPSGPFEFRGSGLGWEEVIYTPINDGTANTAGTEAIVLPDFNIPAGYLTVGKILKYTIMGRVSTAITTPGVLTHRLRCSGVAGTVLCASGGFIPDITAASTNLTWMAEYWAQVRSVGTAGTVMAWGRIEMPDANDIDITNFVIEYNKRMAPAATPATAVVDTTIDRLLSATFQNSVGTGSNTAHVGILEACN